MMNVFLSVSLLLVSAVGSAQSHLPTNRAETAKMDRVALEKQTELRILEMLEADRMRAEKRRQSVIEGTSFNVQPQAATHSY